MVRFAQKTDFYVNKAYCGYLLDNPKMALYDVVQKPAKVTAVNICKGALLLFLAYPGSPTCGWWKTTKEDTEHERVHLFGATEHEKKVIHTHHTLHTYVKKRPPYFYDISLLSENSSSVQQPVVHEKHENNHEKQAAKRK